MANMAYIILITVFVFGSVCGYLNDTKLYSSTYTLPASNNSIGVGTVTELNSASSNLGSADASYFTGYLGWIIAGGKAVGAGILAIFTLGPLMESFGIPVGMAGMFVSPLGLVALMWVISYWTGRESE